MFSANEPKFPFNFYGPHVKNLSKEQVGKIVDQLRQEGFFSRAVESPNKKAPPGPGYTLELFEEGTQTRWEWIGFDLYTLRRLDGLRGVMDGDAAKAMDQLLSKLEKARKAWEKAKQKDPPPPLEVSISLTKDVQELNAPHGLKVTYTNTSAKPIYLKVYATDKLNPNQQAEHLFIGQGKLSDGWVFNVGGVFGGIKELKPGEKWTRDIGDIGFWLSPLQVESIGPLEKPFKHAGDWHIMLESFPYSEQPEFKAYGSVQSKKVILNLRGSLATIGAAQKLKENWKNFMLELNFWGKAGDDKLSLLLTARKLQLDPTPWRLVVEIDEKQVGKIVNALEKSGHFLRAKDVEGKSIGYPAPCYVLSVSAEKTYRRHDEYLGWGPALLAELQNLRKGLDGDAAAKLDQLLKKLESSSN
jgi:hypothetical protein